MLRCFSQCGVPLCARTSEAFFLLPDASRSSLKKFQQAGQCPGYSTGNSRELRLKSSVFYHLSPLLPNILHQYSVSFIAKTAQREHSTNMEVEIEIATHSKPGSYETNHSAKRQARI